MDASELMSRPLPTCHVDLDGLKVEVRALSRAQALYLRTLKDDQVALEVALLRLGLVDPKLDEDQAAAYHDAAAVGEIAAIIDAIRDLSGLNEGAAKSGVPGL